MTAVSGTEDDGRVGGWGHDEATVRPASRRLDLPGLSCVILTAAIAVYLAGRVVSPALRTLPWSLALTLLAVATLALRLATLPDYSHQVQRVTLLTTGSLQAVALLGVGVPVVVLAARALRRLPPVSGNTRMPTTPIG